MNIVNKIKNFLKKYKLLNKTSHYLVGFSGGADSMLLLYYLKNLQNDYGFGLSALHINHDWRGEESELEAKKCEEFCKGNGINFYCEKLGKDIKKDENSARNARYELFDKYAKKIGATAIMTAHNSTDTVETFIYRLLKGTGVEGALSIPEKRSAKYCDIFRPLISVSSKEIREKCKEVGLQYNFDSSNLNNKYKRNYIRNEILPKCEEINTGYEKSILSFIENLRSNFDILEDFLNKVYKKTVKNNKIFTQKFVNFDENLQRKILYKFLKDNDFEPDKELILRLVKYINQNVDKPNGKKYSVKMPKDGNKCFFFASEKESYFVFDKEKNKDYAEFEKEFSSAIKITEYKGEKIPESVAKQAVVNKDSIKFPLTLRYKKAGDVIQPFSHKSQIKLKDYFIKKGIPNHKRGEIPLLCSGNEILWAIGVGISEKLRANLTDKQKCAILEYVKG